MLTLPGLDAFVTPQVSPPAVSEAPGLAAASDAVSPVSGQPVLRPPNVITEAHFKSVQKQLAKRSDPDSIRDAEFLKRVLRGEPLVDDVVTENHALALVYTAIAVARSAPADMTPEHIASFLAQSAGSYVKDLPGLVASAIAKARTMPPLFAAPPRVVGGEFVKDEFVLKKSGDDAGQPVPSAQHNFRLALQRLGVHFRYNAFKAEELIARDGAESVVEDHHVNALSFEIEARFNFFPPTDKFFRFCSTVAREDSYHPIREYLDALPPDAPAGSPADLTETWLIRFGGAPDTLYVRAVSRIVLVAAVRRVRQPGCKFDEMLVLESGQGKFKSSALRALVPNGDWFSDDFRLDANDSRKMMEQTNGHWIIENAELRGMSMHDRNALKAYLSRMEDKARMAYDRKLKTVKRQFVIIGTVNDPQYLNDDNGEDRRFWPVTIVEFDVSGLAAIRDRLWAEAARLEAEGASIRLPRELWPAAAAEQAKRRVEDPFEDVLAAAFGDVRGRILTTDVRKVLGFHEEKHPTQQELNRIGKVMRILGFKHMSLGKGDGRMAKYYVRAEDDLERQIHLEVVGSSAQGWRVRPAVQRELAPASHVPPRPELQTN